MRWTFIGALGCVAQIGCTITTNLDDLQCAAGPCGTGSSPSHDGGPDAPSDAPGGSGATGGGGAGGAGAGAGGQGGSGGSAPCDKTKPFGEPAPIVELDEPGVTELGARLTGDLLTIFFTRATPSEIRIASAVRADRRDAFGAATVVQALVGSGGVEAYPSVTANGLGIYFHTDRAPTGGFELFEASRTSPSAQFVTPVPMTTLNTIAYDAQPYVAPDGGFLLFVRGQDSAGPLDIFQSAWTGAQFGTPISLGVNESTNEAVPVLTPDGRTLYFASNRAGGLGGLDVWRATRPDATAEKFDPAVNVVELDSIADEAPTFVSADECEIYLHSTRGGTMTLYRAVRP